MKNSGKASIRFAVWFCALASAVLVAVLAVVGMPEVQSGPGGLSVLGTFPNVAILVACASVILLCWFRPPRKGEGSAALFSGIAIAYRAAVALILWDSTLWGGCNLHVQILDTDGKPVVGISINLLRQKAGFGFIDALLSYRKEISTRTDRNGEVTISTNRHQHTSGLILPGQDYRFADFSLWPLQNGTMSADVSWSKAGELDDSNMEVQTINPFDPDRAVLRVHLPRRDE